MQALSGKQPCGRSFSQGEDLPTHENVPCSDEEPGNIFSIAELLSQKKNTGVKGTLWFAVADFDPFVWLCL